MATTITNSGICGFTTTVMATSDDDEEVTLSIESTCPNYAKLGDDLTVVDAFEVGFAKVGEGPVFDACRTYCKHPACPVPNGIIKAVEVAAHLALPHGASIEARA
jgi:hypothetical protein